MESWCWWALVMQWNFGKITIWIISFEIFTTRQLSFVLQQELEWTNEETFMRLLFEILKFFRVIVSCYGQNELLIEKSSTHNWGQIRYNSIYRRLIIRKDYFWFKLNGSIENVSHRQYDLRIRTYPLKIHLVRSIERDVPETRYQAIHSALISFIPYC